jgi:hypothetical protein
MSTHSSPEHPGRGLDVRREDHRGPLRLDAGNDLLQRGRREGRLRAVPGPARFVHRDVCCDAALFQDLRPAVAEPAVAYHQALLPAGELPRHRFHTVGASARHHGDRRGAVNRFQGGGNVLHDHLEGSGHMVQRSVGEDHGVFEQAFGVDIGE